MSRIFDTASAFTIDLLFLLITILYGITFICLSV